MSQFSAIQANFNRVRSFTYFYFWRLKNHKDIKKHYAVVGESRIYYETFGTGSSLFLLHGGYLQLECFAAQIPQLTKHFSVVAVDSRGHGRSSHGDKPITYRNLAKDAENVAKALGIDSAYFIGWSDGANTCLELASQNPALIKKMILISANFHPDGVKEIKRSAIVKWISKLFLRLIYGVFSPHPHKWQKLDDQLQTLWQSEPNFSPQSLANISTNTLIIGGEFDLIIREHFEDLAASLPSAELKIINNAGHDPLLTHYKQVNQAIFEFLEK